MAARKPRAKPDEKGVHIHVGNTPVETPDETDADEGEAEALGADFESPIVVKLYRTHPQLGGREAFLTEIAPDAFSQDMVKNTFGGGRYRAQWFGPTKGKAGTRGRGPLKTVSFDVDLSIPPKSPASGPVSSPGDVAPDGPARTGSRLDAVMESGVISLLQTMQNANAAQMAMMKQVLESTQRPGLDIASILTAAAPIVAALIANMGNRPDPMQTAREIAELATTKANPAHDIKSMLEALKELRSLTGESGGSDEDTPAWLRVLERTAGPLLSAAMQRDRSGPVGQVTPGDVGFPGHPAPTDVGAPSIHPSLPVAPATPNEEPAVSPDLMFVRPYVPMLAQWAQQGRSAAWAAETILYDVPAGLLSTVEARLRPDDVVTRMTAAFPSLAPFDVWLGDFRSAMLEQLTGDDTGE